MRNAVRSGDALFFNRTPLLSPKKQDTTLNIIKLYEQKIEFCEKDIFARLLSEKVEEDDAVKAYI